MGNYPGPDLSGQTILVTGASSGIGLATAKALAQAGADVALNYLSMHEAAEKTAAEIQAMGQKALLVPADISDRAAVEEMVDKIVATFGKITGYVSSAVYSDREPFTTANLDGFFKTIDVSLWGAFFGLRACANKMIAQGEGGRVVIVSSPHAQIAFPNCMAYNIAKAGLDQMARSAAAELLPHRIRVNVIYPGWTDTPGERKFFTEETLQTASAKTPLGRLATPDEIAHGILYMMDPRNGYMTGSTLVLDGGLSLPWWSKRDSGDF
ncbi:MAG: SDR family oxidoreductase [Zavarzinella sp.]